MAADLTELTRETTASLATPTTRLAAIRENFGPLAMSIIGAVLLFSWAHAASYRFDVLILASVYSLTSLGMYLPFNMAGSLSIAYSAYVTMGAYAVGIVSIHTSWPLLWGWLLGAVVVGVFAVLLGVVTIKLSGFYLAGVTLLAASVVHAFLVNQTALTLGGSGIGGIRKTFLGSLELDRRTFVIVAIALVLVMAFLLDRLRRSPLGTTIIASNHSATMVNSFGVSTNVLRLVSLGLGAAMASIGGSIFASFNTSIRPDTFPMSFALVAIFMPMLGGSGNAFGAVLGAVVVTDLTVNRPELKDFGPLIFAALVVVILLVAPRGIAGEINRAGRFVYDRARRAVGR